MKQSKPWLTVLLLVAIGVGVCLRFVNLEGKIYWHDEVYTSFRAAGFTRGEIDRTLFQNQFFTAPDLQKFQQIKPGSTAADTIQSLVVEDPQHPPLYFLMARGWMQLFGSSMTASRSLPALLSLLSLPLMYGLAMMLFGSRRVALLATALLALSPFDLLFAQTARQYSLLTVLVIGSSGLLLRAIRRPSGQIWAAYALSVAIGLYTHPFFILTVMGQGGYVLLLNYLSKETNLPIASPASTLQPLTAVLLPWNRRWRLSFQFLLAIGGAIVLYSPWMVVLLNNLQRAEATTSWTSVRVGWLYLVKLWTLSFTALFIDLDFGFDHPLTYLLRIPFVLLIGFAVYLLLKRTPLETHGLILTAIFVPFLVLAIPDLLVGGKRSAVSRYLISCYPAIQLAVAYGLSVGIQQRQQVWRWVLAAVFSSSLISGIISVQATTWWSKDLSYFNAEVVQLVNARADSSPVFVSDMGDDFTNMGDLISLSYGLSDRVRLYTVSQPPNLEPLKQEAEVLVFRASQGLKRSILQQGWQLEWVSAPGRLEFLTGVPSQNSANSIGDP